jgi:hypothetical protein
VIDARNAIQRHVLQHLTDYVALHTCLVRGELMDLGHPYLGPGPVWQPLYVHPHTHLLRRNPKDLSGREHSRKRQLEANRERAARWRALSPTHQLHCLGGHWFAVEIAALPPAPASVWDAVRRCRITQRASRACLALEERAAAELYGQAGVYAVSKRQLSAREIRSYGLERPIRDCPMDLARSRPEPRHPVLGAAVQKTPATRHPLLSRWPCVN